ncbi:hypothetical protein BJ878DRAFT_157058 [Calycina marina]|uniref:Uncharacterized protein n=1 Tax=Calycina marina TaxID=1763456 RepID=A0A9P7Z952_9HELO|nr:hypothetical protein BJ878DRAFT_157058 [Calycina marina]
MATDIDMDMDIDIDIGLMEEDKPQGITMVADALPTPQSSEHARSNAPNDTSSADPNDLTPERVHLRGLDNLTTDDIKAFAAEYYGDYAPSYVQWIDDTSANLAYKTAEIAFGALRAFSVVEFTDPSQIPALQTVTAKSFPAHPETRLEVRLAVAGDRKQAGARDRSRFYLLNPDYDPAEFRKRGGERDRRGRSYRDRDDGGYRSQRYDDREHRKRRDEDAMDGFDRDLYDDDEAALKRRRDRRRERRDRRESSFSGSSDSRDLGERRVRFRGAAGKELFPEKGGPSSRLRDRSASPSRGIAEDLEADRKYIRQQRDNAAAANRVKALAIKERLKEDGTKELFPHKLGISHHRSLAFDATDATADLFAEQMPVPFVDGSVDTDFRRDSGAGSFNIRGAAKAGVSYDFSIRGGAASVKELFPPRSGNADKELFGKRLEDRAGQRQGRGLFD